MLSASLRVPVLLGYTLALVPAARRVVEERVVTAPRHGAPASARALRRRAAPRRSLSAARLADGRRFATLTGFATSPGPDLRVRLVPGDSAAGDAAGTVDLGALKGNRGDQQYAIPAGVRVAGRTLLIWCRAFSAPFGSARLSSEVL